MSSMGAGIKELTALASIISSSVSSIAQDYPDFPSLYDNTPRTPIPANNAMLEVIMAAQQLIASIDPSYPVNAVYQVMVPAALRVAVEAHVVEAIEELEKSPGQGVHVVDLAKFSSMDPKKLARVLRLLASQHFFREMARDTFTNTRPSMMMHSGKKASESTSAIDFSENTSGVAAIVSLFADETMKGASYLSETLLSPEMSHSYSPCETALNVAHKSDLSFFERISHDKQQVDRFGTAMKSLNAVDLDPKGTILGGIFASSSLPRDAVIVDVAGGVGTVSLALSSVLPASVKFVLQDRAEVIQGPAKALWEKERPNDLASGRVTLQSHDLFTPQVTTGDIYLMRYIIVLSNIVLHAFY